ncbi:winged helix-turn-helix domain-containing protein [Streptomyces xanthochromogenes]|uniref:helix-turn-helix domain-containing protein n=1 Tax=Streptomyces TaxID=1883 RepID=UPI001928D017|nr:MULTISPECIES: winged helix-turn-helix domain-containing protein [Streptomyces]MBX7464522.1 winged helix-turn-helix domain-containing protein [Streptomyces sp. MAG02]MCT9088882.1 winged helix-turn-helix domain-containing protein [Streptomyces sp. ASQP_92]MCX5384776.1 winged helix-turn-helix domain-containing protein [Streptomyces sp. NBC_00083]
MPRILVVEARAEAPVCEDVCEDWVRAPIAAHDLQARVNALSRRYRMNRLPCLDESGVLHFSSRSVTVSPTQTELLELLVPNFREVVPREALRYRLGQVNGSRTRNALDLHMMRTRERIQPLGLSIRTVWGRGYVLESQADLV